MKLNNSIRWYDRQNVITLVCPLQDGSPKPNIKWFFNSESIIFTNYSQFHQSVNNYIKITLFDEDSHGVYYCNSSNEYGSDIFIYRVYLAS